MLRVREFIFILCLIFIISITSYEKEFGVHSGADSDSWSQMKWDSILQDTSTNSPRKFMKDKSNNVESPSTFEDETKNDLNGMASKDFAEDEVFSEELVKNKESNKQFSKDEIPVENANENSLTIPEQESISLFENESDDLDQENNNRNENSESQEFPEKTNNAQLHTSNDEVDLNGQRSDFDLLTESFIFNPSAKPQEQFQNCTSPKNESGTCRYLQHCMIPTIVSSLTQFMGFVCIIEGRFIGVCCPSLPVSVVVVQDQKEHSKVENNPNDECGIGTNTRIVGGSIADPKAWPWMVALFSKFRKNFFCGGALINDRYVLTAAHCTFGVVNNEIIARVGEYDFKDDGKSHDEYSIVEMKRHGHYDRRTLRNDIALLKLDRPVVFNEFVKTICFPEGEKDYVGDKATLAGWGNIVGGGKTSHILQEASFPVVSNEECSEGHGLPIPESLICTGAESGDKGACNGDSGGPLMLLDENNRWKAIGLVSWGRRGCNPEFPTVYTRVSYFLEWIQKHAT